MIRHRFAYLTPTDPAAAVAALADFPEATSLVSGGTWVVPELTRGRRRAEVVIDLRRAGLGSLQETEDGGLEIGTCVTYTRLAGDRLVAERAPLLARAAAGITGGVQLRNAATAGGSACYATPSSDVPGVLVALGATMRLRGRDGVREIPASAFFTGAFATALRPGELLVSILVPAQAPHGGWAYHKLKLCGSSWPIATAALSTGRDESRRLVVGGVAAMPVSIDVPQDGSGDPNAIAAATAAAITDPYDDDLADGAYRARIAPALARRAWVQAIG